MTHDEINEKITDIRNKTIVLNGEHKVYTIRSGQSNVKTIFAYTTDWRLAGELLEEMVNVTLNHFDVPDGKWQCSCSYSKFSALSDTPQMAICLAWMEWRPTPPEGE